MKHYFPTMATLAISLMSSVLVPALKADQENKLTNITIDQSIDVQGTVLPPGSYVMKLLGSPADPTTVLILTPMRTTSSLPFSRFQHIGCSRRVTASSCSMNQKRDKRQRCTPGSIRGTTPASSFEPPGETS